MAFENNPPTGPTGSEMDALAVALRKNRPEPTREFTDRLDAAVGDHFPPEWSAGRNRREREGFFRRIGDRFVSRRQALLPAAAGLAGLLVVAVVVGASMDGGGGTGTTSTGDSRALSTAGGTAESRSQGPAEDAAPDPESVSPEQSASENSTELVPPGKKPANLDDANGTSKSTGAFTSKAPGAYAAGVDDRKVATEAEITLGTGPEDVQDVSNEIVRVVDDHDGIVLDSSVQDGPAGRAGANFSLLIPSAQAESAISDLSGIADLRARRQDTEDITAPALTVEDSLRDSRARIEGLVKELAEATSDEDRARVEARLGRERRQAARLNTRLNKFERRANLTPVGVTVETGGDTSAGEDDSAWGIGDAADDAGKMLGFSAGVALIALAIAIPIGLMVLIALALNRAWVRHSRRRALKEN